MAEISNSMVMRTIHLPLEVDEALRSIGFYEKCAKSALIRHFVYRGLANYFEKKLWLKKELADFISKEEEFPRNYAKDLELMRREGRY